MRRITWVVFLVLWPHQAQTQTAAPPKFSCQISEDKLTLRVRISNPYDQPTHCQVNCHLSGSAPGSTFSSSCGETVPANSADFLLCEQQLPDKRTYGAVDASSNAECIKPLSNRHDDDDSDTDDELIKRLQKDGIDALKRLQKQN